VQSSTATTNQGAPMLKPPQASLDLSLAVSQLLQDFFFFYRENFQKIFQEGWPGLRA